jgi:hypothetical protein
MGRPRKIPFIITPVICRYLRDIQNGKEDIEDPTIQTSSSWFLVQTWEDKEKYTSESEANLESFKTFLEEERIAHFPTFQEYEDKYGTNYSIEATQGYLHNLDTNERFDFLKSFPVEVLDLDALKELRSRYCLKQDSKDSVSTKFKSTRKLDFVNGELSFLGIESYSFRDKRAERIFNTLWEARQHIVKGVPRAENEVHRMTTINFMHKAGITNTRQAVGDVVDEAIREILVVVGNARREFNKSKSVFISLECTRKNTLLTVKEY